MATIINNTDTLLSPDAQQEVNNASANYGIDIVYTSLHNGHRDNNNLFDFYSDDYFQEYLFSIDIDADGKSITVDLR